VSDNSRLSIVKQPDVLPRSILAPVQNLTGSTVTT
jgi:hypothetical protein